MRALVLLLLAAPVLHFDISDGRGHKAPGVTIEASQPDSDGWYQLKAVSKTDVVIIWPFDGQAHAPDGRGTIPAIVIRKGDAKALANPGVVAALAAPVVLHRTAQETGLTPQFSALTASKDPFEKGVGLLYMKQPAEAAEQLEMALKDRQRQLTRVPSEIFAAAMLYGTALMEINKFDQAAVAFLSALKQHPSDPVARQARAEALTRAGKGDAIP